MGTSKPQMLRHPRCKLGGIQCVSAYYIRNAILEKDAPHPIQEATAPTMELVMEKLSNFILNTQHNFCNHMDETLKNAMVETLNATDEIKNT